ncbi:hypothetical protein [Micromonospora carbonacea]|uniref:Uncharacterized protein n=1 Tax=Micromonospora carbonacea TaxID=47853 RepID=A0A1C5AXT0_9ACTN|nr:hypothetical protein [Micromonospora carbonacea]SCF50035.1 hypothetical protein GA0070563_12615 [Micromonospora carbonacea]
MAVLRERLDVEVPEGCGACGSAHPVPECWLCGWSHLAAARAAQEAVDAAEAAREAERFALLAQITEAEGRVDDLAGWVARLRAAVDGYPAGSGRSRAVELLADLLARDAAARVTMRGRPGALARVAGVLAVDADWRSGRRAMPGRARSAELAGCTERAVTAAWSRAAGLGWAARTEAGRRLSLAERVETGRAQDRACYDLVPLHRGDVAARAGYVPAALAVLADLVEHAGALLAAAQEHLDGLRARAGGWVERREAARRVEVRAAVTASVEWVRGMVRAFIDGGNLFPPHVVSQGEYLSSCSYRGLAFSPPIAPAASGGRQSRREGRASRSSTSGGRPGWSGCAGSRRAQRPRPAQTVTAGPRARRARPQWTGWAYELARAVQGRWAWLAGVPLARVAATLGAALGPDWTAQALDAWVRRARSRPLLVEPRDPLAYLRAVLEDVLTGRDAPPHPAARHTRHQRVLAAMQAAVQPERRDQARAAGDERDLAAVRPGERSPAAEAALAAIRARTPGHLRRADRAALLDGPATGGGECVWPDVAQPGSGLPHAPRP